MEVAYYPGCSLHQSSQFYDLQTKRIFSELGTKIVEINDWSCCGATSAGKFDDFLAVALPSRNLGIAENAGFTEMLIPCSGCYSSHLMAKTRLRSNETLRSDINAELAFPVKNTIKLLTILELLLEAAKQGKFESKITRQLKGLKPASYYGCMTRFAYDVPVSDNVENPQGMEKILDMLGAETMDWSYKTACCGASAAINDSETAMNLMGKIMKNAVHSGFNCIVTTCPMCQLNLDAYQNTYCNKFGIYERLPVYFITELIGVAMGIPLEELNAHRHFIDTLGLVKELNLI
ncbi:MAG: CoB--CoM heterodisulfide reductase iron-sulfur subunit B family protein [Proteobacteria bacterium]|nr:CoB--CoM heterodisulfide reductase iron-sulfur subunit B family protein [Pseudomonadota bacterium]